MTTSPKKAPLLIGIDGRSGAGKTTLAVELSARLRAHRSVSLFHIEDIYPGWDGLEAGIRRYVDTVLTPLSTAHDAEWTTWDWSADDDGPRKTTPVADVVVIEGVGACSEAARDLLDVTIWVEAEEPERKARALDRDGETYIPFWDTWAGQETGWLADDPVPERADILVRNQADGTAVSQVLDLLCHHPAAATALAPEHAWLASRPVTIEAAGPLDGVDPERLFHSLFGSLERAVWLDSSDAGRPGSTRNRFSILAGGPALGLAATHRAGTTELSRDAAVARFDLPFFRWLGTAWTPTTTPAPDGYDCPFRLGWLGWLGYELKRETGGSDVDTSAAAVPDAALLFADRAVVLDHERGTAWALSLVLPGDDDGWTATVRHALEAARQAPAGPAPGLAAPAFTARDSHRSYLEKVVASQDQIREGNSYEVCLTTTLSAPAPGFDPWEAYRALRRRNPAPFASFLRFGAVTVASTSPERFLSIGASGDMLAEPIKGTRRRSPDPTEDAALKVDLATSLKDRAENVMIVDLLRNDLSHFSVPGSVTVPRLLAIESYATVHQMVSSIGAQLAPGASRVEAIAAAFPAGSMTGAPKISTMDILDGLEDGPRGVYSGAVGYFSLDGSVDLSVVIRTLVAAGSGEDTVLSLGVGGAITADSDPEDEYQEIRTKAFGVLSTLGAEYPGA
ncbi:MULTISPECIES: aminodeoxychorismate synthase component I [Arthrobacter]|uniref:aminodeoxychorismate synthase n=2 Tax=Arthrobacter TaxID=1663 RepID=A0ABU9KML1_9MICC|nr:aminodeoxychorismate synthase component I [Arthrobacter sp. YJM1]MDP5228447.1 aminodeoxychorismate synthase component I [Arthrobacter sp. YJM1]